MDRVDPRVKAKVRAGSQAEADLENLWKDDPRKGEHLKNARKRRTLEPLDSVLGKTERRAEPLSRLRRSESWEETMLLEMVQWKVLKAVFGTRLRPA